MKVPKLLIYSLCLYIFSLPVETSFTILEGHSLSFIIGIFWLLIFLFYVGRRRIVLKKVSSIFYLYPIPIFISIFISLDKTVALKSFQTYIMLLIMLHLFVSTAIEKRILIQTALIFTISSFICILLIFYNYGEIKVQRWWDPRSSSYGADENTLSIIIAVGNTFVIMLRKYYPHISYKVFSFTFLILFPIAVILTGSRTGAIVGIVSYFPIIFEFKSKIIPIIGAIILIYFSLHNTSFREYFPEKNLNRIIETKEKIATWDFTLREKYWRAAIKLFKENIILGIGSGNFPVYAKNQFNVNGGVTHNSYLSVIVETGVLGAILFFSLFIYLFIIVKNNWYQDRVYGFTMLFIICVGMLTLTMEYYKFIWMIYGYIFSYGKLNSPRNENSINCI